MFDICRVCGGDNSTCAPCPDPTHVRTFNFTWKNLKPGFGNFQVSHVQQIPVSDVTTFYSYDNPDANSANTGLERTNAQVLALLFDSLDRTSLLVINDEINDGTGGSAEVGFSVTNVTGANTGFSVTDDPPPGGFDTYTFDSLTGEGSAEWWWQQDTDGTVLGPIRPNACIQLRYGRCPELNKLVIISWDFHRQEPIPTFFPIFINTPWDDEFLEICSECKCPWQDECHVCLGDNSSCADCAGIPNGNTVVDECGVCGGDSSSCADCAGTPNGPLEIDVCGKCGGDGTTCLDCANVVNGTKEVREGECHGVWSVLCTILTDSVPYFVRSTRAGSVWNRTIRGSTSIVLTALELQMGVQRSISAEFAENAAIRRRTRRARAATTFLTQALS